MIETNIPEINVDELMEKIREEVRRRKAQRGKADQHPLGPHQTAQATLFQGIDHVNIGTIPEPEPFEFKEGGYHINDFLKHHDMHFVMNAYRGILRRGPDSGGGEHFVANLRSARMTKAEILGRLRYSSEGRVKKVKIKGLFWNFVVQSFFRIPVLGYFSRLTVGIVNLPVIIRNLNTLEANTFAQLQALHNHINTLADTAQFKINELIEKHGQVEGVLEQKADKVELSELGMQKAGKEQIEPINKQIREILRQTRDNKLNILDQQKRLKLFLEEARKRLPEPFSREQLENLVSEEAHLHDAMYVAFEDHFRGTREDIKERQKVYLPYIEKVMQQTYGGEILDVGCGRGEWLELLKEEGHEARGVDINRVVVARSQEIGLDVVAADALDYLKDLPANSLAAVTGFHIIEHLPFNTLIALFDESLRVLKPEGLVIFETPNPENLIVGAHYFYIDPTHINPLVPSTMQFIIEQRGFNKIEIKRLHKYSDYHQVTDEDSFQKEYMYNEMDFAVIGYKA